MTKRKAKAKKDESPAAAKKLYTMEVALVLGPVSEEFVKNNPVVSRTIQIRGDQTLAHLHDAIFCAYDREEEHMYEFQIGGKRPMDPKARRYAPRTPLEPFFVEEEPAGDVSRTTIGSLRLRKNRRFWYWFDFGDDWWHNIRVTGAEKEAPEGRYPRVTKRVGQSPPQYPDWDEEE